MDKILYTPYGLMIFMDRKPNVWDNYSVYIFTCTTPSSRFLKAVTDSQLREGWHLAKICRNR